MFAWCAFRACLLLAYVLCSLKIYSGIISVLDEELFIPRGSDKGFVSKLVKAQEKHPAFAASKFVCLTTASLNIEIYIFLFFASFLGLTPMKSLPSNISLVT